MKSNSDEMSWEEVAAKLNEANNLLAQNYNKLTKEYLLLLVQMNNDETLGKKSKTRGKLKLKSARG